MNEIGWNQLIYGSLTLAIALYLLIRGFRKQLAIKSFTDLEAVDINTLEKGTFAKVEAKVVVQGEALQAPLSGGSCAFFMMELQKKLAMKDGGELQWKTVDRYYPLKHILLQDSTGSILVKANECDYYLQAGEADDSEVVETSLGGELPVANEKVEDFKKRVSKDNQKWRTTEKVLKQGALVTVMGAVAEEKLSKEECQLYFGKNPKSKHHTIVSSSGELQFLKELGFEKSEAYTFALFSLIFSALTFLRVIPVKFFTSLNVLLIMGGVVLLGLKARNSGWARNSKALIVLEVIIVLIFIAMLIKG